MRGVTKRTESIRTACVEICESRYDRMLLSVIDTPGLVFQEGHELSMERQVSALVRYIDTQFADTMNEVSMNLLIVGSTRLLQEHIVLDRGCELKLNRFHPTCVLLVSRADVNLERLGIEGCSTEQRRSACSSVSHIPLRLGHEFGFILILWAVAYI